MQFQVVICFSVGALPLSMSMQYHVHLHLGFVLHEACPWTCLATGCVFNGNRLNTVKLELNVTWLSRQRIYGHLSPWERPSDQITPARWWELDASGIWVESTWIKYCRCIMICLWPIWNSLSKLLWVLLPRCRCTGLYLVFSPLKKKHMAQQFWVEKRSTSRSILFCWNFTWVNLMFKAILSNLNSHSHPAKFLQSKHQNKPF